MDPKNIFLSKNFKLILGALAALVIVLLAFRAGTIVGQRQADFFCHWGENYHRNFGGPNEGFAGDFANKNFIDGHGNVGEIIKIEDKDILIKDPTGTEKIINLSQETTIRNGRDSITANKLKIGDKLVIIGEPKDDGTIDCKFIRVFNENDQPPLPPRPDLMNFKYPNLY
ncbi:MAG: hypothetical protein WCX71_03420 [Candidatus Buchananbacteria bacterium]